MRFSAPLLALALAAPACATQVGPRSLPKTRMNFNEAVAESQNQQVLLNLVRLRYLHTVQFLELTSVVAQYSLTTSAGVGATGNFGSTGGFAPPASVNGNVGISATERPTVTYTPLQGEDYVNRLVTPIAAEAILMLLDAGWNVELLMGCCVRRINHIDPPVYSSRSAGGDHFRRVGQLLEQIHRRHQLEVEVEMNPDGDATWLVFRPDASGQLPSDSLEVLRLLRVSPHLRRYRVRNHGSPGPDEIEIRGRSLIGVLFYLSQGVDVADGDPTARDLGVAAPIRGPFLHVRSSTKAPDRAAVRIRYRGRWYYVDDADEAAKRAFGLVQTFFSLMSSGRSGAPVLTVSTGS